MFCVVANSILTGLHPPDLCHNKVVVNIALGILQAFAGQGYFVLTKLVQDVNRHLLKFESKEFTTGFRCCGTALFWYIAETGSNSLLSKVLVFCSDSYLLEIF